MVDLASTRFNGKCRIVSWNARALLHFRPWLRRRKLKLVRSWMADSSLICLREVHGDADLMESTFSDEAGGYSCFAAPGVSSDSGGLLTLLPLAALKGVVGTSFSILVKGRVSRLCVELLLGAMLVIWNFHVHDISSEEVKQLNEYLAKDLEVARRNPLKCEVIVAGDWNFSP